MLPRKLALQHPGQMVVVDPLQTGEGGDPVGLGRAGAASTSCTMPGPCFPGILAVRVLEGGCDA